MSVNPEALQKLLMEMDNQLNKTRAELSISLIQLDKVNTNLNLIKGTSQTLHQVCDVGSNEKVWQGIGKCFVQNGSKSYLEEIEKDEKYFKEQKDGLLKKHNYLETTLEKTADNMTQIVGGPRKS